HYLEIDMGVSLTVDAFHFIQRTSGTRNIKNILIEVSNDDTNWESLGVYSLQQTTGDVVQDIVLPETKSFRYFKLTVRSTDDVYDGTQFAALAEVWVTAP